MRHWIEKESKFIRIPTGRKIFPIPKDNIDQVADPSYHIISESIFTSIMTRLLFREHYKGSYSVVLIFSGAGSLSWPHDSLLIDTLFWGSLYLYNCQFWLAKANQKRHFFKQWRTFLNSVSHFTYEEIIFSIFWMRKPSLERWIFTCTQG